LQEAQHYFKKKASYYKERDQKKREIFEEELEKIAEKDRVYVDESGIDKYLTRQYGGVVRGKEIFGAISGLRYA